MRDETDECMAAGMVGHLPKPIDPLALAATLARLAAEQAVASGPVPPAAGPPGLVPLAAGPGLDVRGGRIDEVDEAASPGVDSGADVDRSYVEMLLDSLGAAKLGELVRDLPGHAQPHRERLGESHARGDAAQLAAAAHALTGMAANLGLTGPAELSAAIEDACRNGRAGEVGDLCEQWSLSFDRSVARLRTLCPGPLGS